MGDIQEKKTQQDTENTVEKNVLREEFIFKGEIDNLLEDYKNKCITSILWTAECSIADINSKEFKQLRKSVMDSVNDYKRKAYEIIEDSLDPAGKRRRQDERQKERQQNKYSK